MTRMTVFRTAFIAALFAAAPALAEDQTPAQAPAAAPAPAPAAKTITMEQALGAGPSLAERSQERRLRRLGRHPRRRRPDPAASARQSRPRRIISTPRTAQGDHRDDLQNAVARLGKENAGFRSRSRARHARRDSLGRRRAGDGRRHGDRRGRRLGHQRRPGKAIRPRPAPAPISSPASNRQRTKRTNNHAPYAFSLRRPRGCIPCCADGRARRRCPTRSQSAWARTAARAVRSLRLCRGDAGQDQGCGDDADKPIATPRAKNRTRRSPTSIRKKARPRALSRMRSGRATTPMRRMPRRNR